MPRVVSVAPGSPHAPTRPTQPKLVHAGTAYSMARRKSAGSCAVPSERKIVRFSSDRSLRPYRTKS